MYESPTKGLDLCACRQELSALREDFVRRQAEEEAHYAQEVGVCPFCLLEAKMSQESFSGFRPSKLRTGWDVVNAGAAAEGRGAAEKTSLAGGWKTGPTEGKVSQHKQHSTFVRLWETSVCCRSALCRFAVMEGELRVQESLLDTTRKRFLKHRQDQRTKQIQALDEEISRKVTNKTDHCGFESLLFCPTSYV